MDGPYLVFPLVLHLHLLQIQEQRPRLSSHLWGDPLVDSPAHLQERRGPKTGAGDTWHNGCSGEVASAWTWAGLYMWRGHVWSTLWCPGPEWPGKPQGTQGSSLQGQDVQVSTFRLPWYLLQFLSIFTHLVARLMSWALCWKRGHGGVSQAASFPRVALTQGHDLILYKAFQDRPAACIHDLCVQHRNTFLPLEILLIPSCEWKDGPRPKVGISRETLWVASPLGSTAPIEVQIPVVFMTQGFL